MGKVPPELLADVPPPIRRRMWFQHNGASAHFSWNVRHYIDNIFPNRWIGRNGTVSWPAKFPDMTHLDYSFWGHTKSSIYEAQVESEMDFVARILVSAGQIAENS